MRFGKTFTSYQLAKQMNLKKVLVLTYKPAVETSWRDDLLSHVDFLGWQFVSRRRGNLETLDKSKPFVYFASFQDILGTQESGEIKKHNEWIHNEQWDLIIQDEYHFGAWRENVKELLDTDVESQILGPEEGSEDLVNSINGKMFLYLSGTPFRALDSGEFSENQVFNWIYSDEQNAKEKFVGANNPYASLPRMNIFTYEIPKILKDVASGGEYNEFSLSHFFKAVQDENGIAKFIHEEEVQKWLDIIEGKKETKEDIVADLKLKRDKIRFPFLEKYKELNHMIWLLPNDASCFAMETMLKDKNNKFYNKFNIVVAAGERGGSGTDALIPLQDAIGDNPLESKTITLTCGKLTTGVTVAPWTGIFMLRTLNSPESYFQSAFRVQSPWVVREKGKPAIIQKEECYVFDFDPNRALSQIASYASKLDIRDVTTEVKINDIFEKVGFPHKERYHDTFHWALEIGNESNYLSRNIEVNIKVIIYKEKLKILNEDFEYEHIGQEKGEEIKLSFYISCLFPNEKRILYIMPLRGEFNKGEVILNKMSSKESIYISEELKLGIYKNPMTFYIGIHKMLE